MRLLLVLAAAASLVAADAPEIRTQNWAIARLDLDVTVDPGRKILVQGTMTVRLEDETSEGPAFALNSRKMAMRVRRLEAEGTSASVFRYREDLPIEAALLRMPRTFHRGDTLDVSFVVESEAESSQLRIGSDAVFASWVENWYPVPATVGQGVGSPAAAGSTTLRLPAGWRSVSNGTLDASLLDNGRRIERWVTTTPAARSFVAAPFAAVESVESEGRRIAFYLLQPRKSAQGQATSLARSLQIMEARFGPYPYDTCNVAEVPEGASFAAASEQGFIMVRTSVLDDVGASVPLFAHEAAHGWWGNLVRNAGDGGKMLGEALAQYGAVLSIETIEGVAERDRFLRFSRPGYSPVQCALGYFYIWRQGGDKPLAQLSDGQWDHNLSDSKGMWFFHMLRQKVGDEVFFSTLRSVLHDFPGQRVKLEELRRRFIENAHDPSLPAFLQQWLDRTGAPVIDLDWWSIDRGKSIEIHLSQIQSGDPFSVALDLAIDLDDGTTLRKEMVLTERTQTATFPTPARALAVRMDPDHRILMWRPEFGPRPDK